MSNREASKGMRTVMVGDVMLLAPAEAVEDAAALDRYMAQPYMERIRALSKGARAKPGVLLQADVRHDAWCPVLAGTGLCTCNPDVALRVVSGGERK